MKIHAASLLTLAVLLSFEGEPKATQVNPPKLWGIAYGAFRDGQSPGGVYPSKADIGEDMKILRDFTVRIRTYSVNETQQFICRLAQEAGIMCYAGAHIDSDPIANDDEIERLLQGTDSSIPAGFVVGNEVLFHGNLPRDELISLIRKVKNDDRVRRWGIPVGYADVYTTFLNDPGLVAELDFLLIHIHPYHDGIPVDEAPEYVYEKWRMVKNAYPGMEVIIGETGWPTKGATKGGAVPCEANQQEFLRYFVKLALKENIPYFFFEAFDENWKREASGVEAEAHWGLWYSDRTMKPRRFFCSPSPLIDILRPAACGAGPDRVDNIAGRVYGIHPGERSSYRVVIYAKTNRWYVQPFESEPLTLIRGNLTWSNRIHLGGFYAALLVREGYRPGPQLDELPPVDDHVLAIAVKVCR